MMSIHFGKLKSFHGYSVGPGVKGEGRTATLNYKGESKEAGAYSGNCTVKGDQFSATFKTTLGDATFEKTLPGGAWAVALQTKPGSDVEKLGKAVAKELTADANILAEKSKRLADVKTEKLDATLTMMVYDDILKLDA